MDRTAVRPLAEAESPEVSAADDNAEVEYSFEGFEVEFSERIALLPPDPESR